MTKQRAGHRLDPMEVRPGLVLWLDPEVLAQGGGHSAAPPERWVRGLHHFLVVDGTKFAATLLPLYSSGAHLCRHRLDNQAMSGSPHWTLGTWHWDARQVWRAPVSAILAAASHDLSTPGRRNRLGAHALPAIWRQQ